MRYTDRKGGEAVEYGDLELVRGIKGGDKGGVRAAGPPLVSAGLWVRDDQGDDLGIRPEVPSRFMRKKICRLRLSEISRQQRRRP